MVKNNNSKDFFVVGDDVMCDDVIIDDVITVGNMQIRCKHHLIARYGRKMAVFAHYLNGADNYGQTDTPINMKLFLHTILYVS